MSPTVVSGVFGWFFSCPEVIEMTFIFASFLACLFGIIGYAKRE